MTSTPLAAGLSTLLAVAMAATPAHAGTPSGPYAMFQHCPYTDPEVGSCVINTTTSGALAIGNTVVPIDAPVVLQGGIQSLDASPLYDAVGAPTLSAAPAKVPGGLLGLVNPHPDWPGPLWTVFWTIVATANDVNATIEPVETIQTNFANTLNPPTDASDPTVARLAVRVHLQNPFLGNHCYIGSAQEPVVLKLQTGTTNPPPPNAPISGETGTGSIVVTDPDNFIGYLHVEDSTLVDNAFAVPAAHGCGNVALGLPILTPVLEALVSGAVNAKVGLPSAAGRNTAVLSGDASIAAAAYVLDSEE